mmetsp:Transcript_26639/g.58398  ORF Transcript_26639/g.58398 Transcript_26639/m.58398 type:complete len:486 (+) Transcript_26639:178-1635(+)
MRVARTAVLVAGLACMASLCLWNNCSKQSVDLAAAAVFKRMESRPFIPVLRRADKLAILEAVESRQPTLWRQSPVNDWAAMRLWTQASVLSKLIPWGLARVQEGCEFVQSDPRRTSAPLLTRAREALPHRRRNVSVYDFFSTEPQGAKAGRECVYMSGTIGSEQSMHWQTPRLLADMSPSDLLSLQDVPPLLRTEPWPPPPDSATLPQNQTTRRLWLSGAGVVTRTHYDKGHTMLAQIVGRKLVLLWRPEQLHALRLYPAVHEAHRQSQLSFTSDQADLLALAEKAGSAPAIVSLSPGDLLYIPPYFAHAVLALDSSATVAVVSESWEQARWARSGWVPAPLGRAAGSRCRQARAAAALISLFLRELCGRLSCTPTSLLLQLYNSRYLLLYGDIRQPLDGEFTLLAQCLQTPSHEDALEDGAWLQQLHVTGSAVADILVDADETWQRRYDPSVAEQLAGDYVEEVAGWACGADGVWRLLQALLGD